MYLKDARWRKSSYTNTNGACVELSCALGAMRDSKDPHGPILPVATLAAFIRDVKAGRFDR